MEASVNRIIQSSLVDGPGSRTVIFMQGCNMSCLYCHNPETQNASPKAKHYSLEELFDLIEKHQDFIEGVTFSGGECTLQHEFIIAFYKLLHERTKLTLFLDTNGLVSSDIMIDLINHSDGLMIDLKAFSQDCHRALTYTDNSAVKENIRLAAQSGKLHEVRLTLVEDFNDDPDELSAYFDFVLALPGDTRLKIIPYSPFGVKGSFGHKRAYPKEKYDLLVAMGQRILKDRVLKVWYNWRK